MIGFARQVVTTLYRGLYHAQLWIEEHEFAVSVYDLLVVVLNLAAFVGGFVLIPLHLVRPLTREEVEELINAYMSPWHFDIEIAELVLFALLLVSVLARIFIAIRRRHLGYNFARVLGKADRHGGIDFDDLFERLRQLPWGSAPCRECGAVTAIAPRIAESIAATSASLLSERSLLREDDAWYRREKEYLHEWISRFPWCVWRLPEAAAPQGDPCQGYVSVIVPVTDFSVRSIRNGHRATDTAEIDDRVLECFLHADEPDCARPASPPHEVRFLAYVQLRVSDSGGAVEHERLLAASLQHLAMLLHGIYGAAKGFRQRWNFSILCETANWRQERVVTGLGFMPLETALDKERAHRHPARSFAGFPLFGFTVRDGEPDEGFGLTEGARFLRFLEDQVSAYAALAGAERERKAEVVGESIAPYGPARSNEGRMKLA